MSICVPLKLLSSIPSAYMPQSLSLSLSLSLSPSTTNSPSNLITHHRSYCERELKAGDTGFLIPETIDFCVQHNPLFLERPDWLRNATCISAYIFPAGYLFILWVALMGHWRRFYVTVPVLLFVGVKLNAIYFYHIMEFTRFVYTLLHPLY